MSSIYVRMRVSIAFTNQECLCLLKQCVEMLGVQLEFDVGV